MKTLLIDLETSPYIGAFFDRYNQNIGMSQIIELPRVLCFGAKFLGEKKTHYRGENKMSHEDMMMSAWEFCNEADAVVTYNGEGFDLKWLNTEFERCKLPRPSPMKSLDLYRIVKKNFRLPSYKLGDVLTFFGHPGKVSHEGIKLWLDVRKNDPKAWKLFEKYVTRDTTALDDLYYDLQPYFPAAFNKAVIEGKEHGCPSCGKEEYLVKEGFSYTSTGKFQRYVCQNCGRWSTDTRRLEGVRRK